MEDNNQNCATAAEDYSPNRPGSADRSIEAIATASERRPKLAVIGGTGEIAEIFIRGLLEAGIQVRLLARSPKKASGNYPTAEIVKGSMMNREDAAKVIKGVDAALLITPIAARNNKAFEVQTALPTIEAAKAQDLPHLIFISCIAIDHETGVALLDAKLEIENLMRESGVPWTSIRCGSYMEDVIDVRKKILDKGWFVFPVSSDLKFNFTAQKDIPRLVHKLLNEEIVLNGHIDFIAPDAYSPGEVANLMSSIAGRRIRASGKVPLLWILKTARPIFHLKNHRMSTIIHLIEHFNKHGYTGDSGRMTEKFPDFKMTGLEEHLIGLLG